MYVRSGLLFLISLLILSIPEGDGLENESAIPFTEPLRNCQDYQRSFQNLQQEIFKLSSPSPEEGKGLLTFTERI